MLTPESLTKLELVNLLLQIITHKVGVSYL